MTRTLKKTASKLAVGAALSLMVAWPAASQERPNDAPVLGKVIVALAVSEACNVITSEGRATLKAFLDRSIREDEANTSRSYKSSWRRFAELFSGSMRKAYSDPSRCTAEAKADAVSTLHGAEKYISNEAYWSLIRNPPPSGGEAMELKSLGKKCSGLFTPEQRATIEIFLATEILKNTRSSSRRDASSYLETLQSAEDGAAGGWWLPRQCSDAVRTRAHETLKRIEAFLPSRLN